MNDVKEAVAMGKALVAWEKRNGFGTSFASNAEFALTYISTFPRTQESKKLKVVD